MWKSVPEGWMIWFLKFVTLVLWTPTFFTFLSRLFWSEIACEIDRDLSLGDVELGIDVSCQPEWLLPTHLGFDNSGRNPDWSSIIRYLKKPFCPLQISCFRIICFFVTRRNFHSSTFSGKKVLFWLQLPDRLFAENQSCDILHFTSCFRTKSVWKNYLSRQPQREWKNAQAGNVKSLKASFLVFKVSVILVCNKEISSFLNRLKPQPKLFSRISREQSTKNRYQQEWKCRQRKAWDKGINRTLGKCLWPEIVS